jgi:hypothetical protein
MKNNLEAFELEVEAANVDAITFLKAAVHALQVERKREPLLFAAEAKSLPTFSRVFGIVDKLKRADIVANRLCPNPNRDNVEKALEQWFTHSRNWSFVEACLGLIGSVTRSFGSFLCPSFRSATYLSVVLM